MPVDDVVAGAADREGLAPHLCHFRLYWSKTLPLLLAWCFMLTAGTR